MKFLYRLVQGFLGFKIFKTKCSVCDFADISFMPLSDFFRSNAEQYGYAYFGKGEMTALETYSCSRCGASDRERLYALWLDKEIKKGTFLGKGKVIHFAPEKTLSEHICKRQIFDDYQTADLMMETTDHKADLMALPFSDNSYDFFICSHVLEHVPDDRQAIRELYRITRPGGLGILMAPVIVGLANTLEDPEVVTEADRWRLFGQGDHVRLYAHDDYISRIEHGGFKVQQLGIKEFGASTFAGLGLKPTSILYVAIKQ
jgi:SAM-dependent methyltransferase